MRHVLSRSAFILRSEPVRSHWYSFVALRSQDGTHANSRSLTYHYLRKEITEDACQDWEPMSLAKLLDISLGKNNILECAKLLQKQLPLRLAKCIVAFHALPFIVASNPSLLRCQELYLSAHHLLKSSVPVVNSDAEADFSSCIQDFLDNHKEVISLLSQGFKEAGKYVQDKQMITKFLNEMMRSRLGIRLLCDHYLQLPLERRGYLGSIETKFSPKNLTEWKSREARLQCERKYGSAPEVTIDGDVRASFMYIAPPLEYIMNELLKNSMRAVMESRSSNVGHLPRILVTVINNDVDFGLRVSDKGGGIRPDMASKVWEYGFSSTSLKVTREDAFDLMSESRSSGTMFGYGFGLPVCKAFIEHLGGDLRMVTTPGYGTDVYIRLPHIEGKEGNFFI